MPLPPLNEEQTEEVYSWVNEMNLPKASSQIHRDFADAINAATLVKSYMPNAVELHNYQPAVSMKNKLDNWQTLDHKVLEKIGIKLSSKDLEQLASATPGRIESVLFLLKQKFTTGEEEIEQQPVLQRKAQAEEKEPQAQEEIMQKTNPFEPQEEESECRDCELKDKKIKDLTDDIELLEQKIDKLQQLVRLKDGKNKALEEKIEILERK